jgi:hypothetical protein
MHVEHELIEQVITDEPEYEEVLSRSTRRSSCRRRLRSR